MTATTPKTTPTINDLCAMVLTTGGGVGSNCLTGAVISDPLLSNSILVLQPAGWRRIQARGILEARREPAGHRGRPPWSRSGLAAGRGRRPRYPSDPAGESARRSRA